MNQVILEGAIVALKLNDTAGGNTVANFRVATDDPQIGANGNEFRAKETHWCVAWNEVAETLKDAVEGQIVRVEGRLASRSYEDVRTGQRKYKLEIIAHSVALDGVAVGVAATKTPELQRHFDRTQQRRDKPQYEAAPDDNIPF
jgi:single-strand DNA-binding protein